MTGPVHQPNERVKLIADGLMRGLSDKDAVRYADSALAGSSPPPAKPQSFMDRANQAEQNVDNRYLLPFLQGVDVGRPENMMRALRRATRSER